MWHSRPPRDSPPFMANTILNFHFDYPHPSLRRLAYDLHAMNQYTNIIRSIIIGTTTIYQIHSRLPALSGGGLYHLWEHWSGCRKWAFVDNSINWKRTHFRLAKKHTCLIANSGYRISLYLHNSVWPSVYPPIVTYHLFLIIWWFKPSKPYIF